MKRIFSISLVLTLSVVLSLVLAGLQPTQIIRAQADLPPATELGGESQPAESIAPPVLSDSAPTLPPDLLESIKGGFCEMPAVGWQLRTPLSTAVFGNAVASDGVYVYSAGGNTSSGITNAFLRYDPVSDSWTTLAPLPTAVLGALAVYAEGRIFVFGGTDFSIAYNLLQIYTIASNTWAAGTSMPAGRHLMGGGYINGKIFIVGGYLDMTLTGVTNQTWSYDLGTTFWETKTNLPTALAGAGSAVANGMLYILGGQDSSGTTLNTVYRYDPIANGWTTEAPMPTAVNLPGTVVYANHIWVFGGGAPFGPESLSPQGVKAFTSTWIYSFVTSSWSAGPAQNVGRYIQGGAVVRNQIVSIGGALDGSPSNTVEVATQAPLNILIIYADVNPPTTLQFQLLSQPGVGRVDLYNAASSTPASSWIFYDYDVIVPFSNAGWADAATLGNYLAEYLFSGGGVVVGFNFDWSSAPFALAGNWQSGGYSPFNADGTSLFVDGTLGAALPGHPLLAGITSLNAHYRQTLTAAAGASVIAAWNDAKPLIARKGNAIGVSAYVGDYPASWSGDFAKLIVNAGYWLRQDNGSCTNLVCTNPTIIQGAITDTDATQTGRLLRNNPEATCAAGVTCSLNDTDPGRHYDAYYFMNNTASEQCITVTLDAKTCIDVTHTLQSAAYTTFDPANLCNNFLGDIGGSPVSVGLKSYSFKVPAWERYTVTVNEVYANAFCPAYALQVSAGDCPIKKVNLPMIRR